jgi:hypothetical protein
MPLGNASFIKRNVWFSEARETQWGKQHARELEQNQILLSDPQVLDYVNRLGQNLVANSDAKGPVTIKVLQSDEGQLPDAPRIPVFDHRCDHNRRK